MTVKHIFHFLMILLALPFLVACEDHFPAGDYEVGEGMSIVAATVGFESFGEVDLASRASGSAIKSINSLYLFFYDAEENIITDIPGITDSENVGSFIDGVVKISNYRVDNVNNDRPAGEPEGTVSAETNTPHASFSMRVPYGRYHIYAVANVDVSTWDKSKYETVDALLSNSFAWQQPDASGDNVARNNQMFGFFTADKSLNATDKDGNSLRFSDNDEIYQYRSRQLTVINKPNQQLTAWIKRLASKVTIAFDTRKLYDNVYIYIKSVAIKDIPRQCVMGKDNHPTDYKKDLYTTGETFYFADADASQTDARANHLKWRELNSGDSIYGYASDLKGFKENLKSYDEHYAYEHSETAPALYFYENMQGIGNDRVNNKLQDADGDGEVDFPYPEDGDPSTGWKDGKSCGSYVEVEGYYVCEDSVRPGRGPITYRFMMGKNTRNDFNAERNRHYKLTLQFKGYANDIDWHIDYKEEFKPGSNGPDTVYVSYMYNQAHTFPIRSTPREGYLMTGAETVILQNEWRPHLTKEEGGEDAVDYRGYDYYNKKAWDMQKEIKGYYAEGNVKVQYDTEANDPDRKNNDPNCEYGWLSLREVALVQIDLEESGTAAGIANMVANARLRYFTATDGDTEGSNGYREYTDIPSEPTGEAGHTHYNPTDGDYTVHHTYNAHSGERNYVLNIPLFTRAKSIGANWAVYSGANPFYEHKRFARIRTVIHFKNSAGQTYNDTVYTVVMQSERIDNPRGIMRDWDNLTPFRVVLRNTVLDPDATREFVPFESRGPWSATIERDPYGLVRLTRGSQIAVGEGNSVTGPTGTRVEFTYNPNRMAPPDGALGAVITVRYNNNSCVHKIFVRQGYGPVQFKDGGLKWSTFNLYRDGEFAKSPLSPGSFFKNNTNVSAAVAESNNYNKTKSTTSFVSFNQSVSGFGVVKFDKPCGFGVDEYPISSDEYTVLSKNSATKYTWSNIPGSSDSSASFGTFTVDGITYRVPTYREVKEEFLRQGAEVQFAFGMVYADGATTNSSTSDAYSYYDEDNKGLKNGCGMRGAIAWCLGHGDNVFFPFGASGHGRRTTQAWIINQRTGNSLAPIPAGGLLAYGDVRGRLGGYSTASAAGSFGNAHGTDSNYKYANDYRPLAYRLPEQYGALYWFDSAQDGYMALDFNSNNFQASDYPTGNVSLGTNNGDALLLKPVVN